MQKKWTNKIGKGTKSKEKKRNKPTTKNDRKIENQKNTMCEND
jgi:hypothetical protein